MLLAGMVLRFVKGVILSEFCQNGPSGRELYQRCISTYLVSISWRVCEECCFVWVSPNDL